MDAAPTVRPPIRGKLKNRNGLTTHSGIEKMARPEGFEPPTTWFVARYSIQLSYGRPEKTRGEKPRNQETRIIHESPGNWKPRIPPGSSGRETSNSDGAYDSEYSFSASARRSAISSSTRLPSSGTWRKRSRSRRSTASRRSNTRLSPTRRANNRSPGLRFNALRSAAGMTTRLCTPIWTSFSLAAITK